MVNDSTILYKDAAVGMKVTMKVLNSRTKFVILR